jgi:hypothetical protein
MRSVCFETVADANMKLHESSTEAHKVYSEVSDMRSTSCSDDVDGIFELFPCRPKMWLTRRLWLWLVKFILEGGL